MRHDDPLNEGMCQAGDWSFQSAPSNPGDDGYEGPILAWEGPHCKIEENSVEEESLNLELDFEKEMHDPEKAVECGDGAGALEMSLESLSSLIHYEVRREE